MLSCASKNVNYKSLNGSWCKRAAINKKTSKLERDNCAFKRFSVITGKFNDNGKVLELNIQEFSFAIVFKVLFANFSC